MHPVISDRFDEALRLAVEIHRHDERKGSRTPTVAHLLSVCALALEDGGTEDEAVAALLHDVLEDHPESVSRALLRDRFGDRVLALVEGCTDTPADYTGGVKPPWRPRKERYLARVRCADLAAVRVSMADKLHNARSILADYRRIGDAVWARFNVGRSDPAQIRAEVLWYYRAATQAFREAGAAGFLIEELERTLDEIDRRVASRGRRRD